MVVLPSLPVTPITLHGAKWSNSLISEVITAPSSLAMTNSFLVGRIDGLLKIISKPCK